MATPNKLRAFQVAMRIAGGGVEDAGGLREGWLAGLLQVDRGGIEADREKQGWGGWRVEPVPSLHRLTQLHSLTHAQSSKPSLTAI